MASQTSSRTITLLLLIIVAVTTLDGAPKGTKTEHSKKGHTPKKLQAKSYIDIDASDPFKVPKSSKYVDQPIPDFDEARTKVENEEGSQPGKLDALNLQQDIPASLDGINSDAPDADNPKFRTEVSKEDVDTTSNMPQTNGEEQGGQVEQPEENGRQQPDAQASEAENQQSPEVEPNDDNASRSGQERHHVPKRNGDYSKEFEKSDEAPNEEQATSEHEKANEE